MFNTVRYVPRYGTVPPAELWKKKKKHSAIKSPEEHHCKTLIM